MRCLLGVFASIPVVALAQTTALPPVVVVGTREPTSIERVVADVTVIDADRIRAASADSIEDLLRREGGIQMSRNGGPGQSANVFIRGAAASQSVVLIDGVRIGSASLGQADLSAISLAHVERIEILRGPGSSLYGADAVGGVINIVTRRAGGTPAGGGRLALGQLRSSEASAHASGTSGAFDIAASLAQERSDGVSAVKPGDTWGFYNPDDDGFRRGSAVARLGWRPAEGHRIGASIFESRLRSQYDGALYPPPTFASDPSPDFRNRFDTRVSTLDYRGRLANGWTTTVALSRQSDDLASGADAVDRFRTERDQATWQNAWAFAPGQQALLALESLHERVEAASLGAGVPERRNNAIVLGLTGQGGIHRWQADLRHDDNSVYGGETTGKLGWSSELQPGFSLRAVAGTTFRAPTFNDLYYPGFGVATVTPEHGRSIEAGAQWRFGPHALDVTVYRNDLRDMIAYEPDLSSCPPGYSFGCARNFASARLDGATITASGRWGAWAARLALDFLDAIDRDTGQRLPRRAAHQESLSLDWTQGAWSAGGTVVAVGQRPEQGRQLGAYATLDLQARWRVARQWQIEAKLLNATDRQYEPVLDAQVPGRQAWIGARFETAGF